MSGWHHYKAKWEEKTCDVCGNVFIPRSGAHRFCSESCKGKWKYITGKDSTENQYKKVSGNWYKYFQRLVNQKQRKEHGLKAEDLLAILEEQKYLCALSGQPLTCLLEKGLVCKTNASLDRIEAGGPYIKSNIQLVCRALNSWRTDTKLSEFIWWCKKVTDFQEGKE